MGVPKIDVHVGTETTALSANALPQMTDPPAKSIAPTDGTPSLVSEAISTGEGELQCNFDDPTTLYKLLDASEWEKAAERINTHPNEVKTWIVRRDSNKVVMWKLLPLHAAILFQSPVSIARAILEKYPKAASRCDDRGMLPLHLAFRKQQNEEELLEMLLVHYPKGVLVKDQRDRVPLEYCKNTLFSAKLMHLYADATVAGATVMGSSSVSGDTSSDVSTTSATTNMIKKQEEEIAILKASHEKELADVKKDHQDELDKLHQKESKACAAKDETPFDEAVDVKYSSILVKTKLEAEKLKVELERSRNDKDMMRIVLKGTKLYNEELTSRVQEIMDDQKKLATKLAEQQEELQAAQAMRKQLLHTILQQEEEDNVSCEENANELTELAEKVSVGIEEVLSRAPPDQPFGGTKELPQIDDISAMTDLSVFA